jgi:hypothetical protein
MLGPEIHRALAQATEHDIARHARRASPPRSIVYEAMPALTNPLAVLALGLPRAPVSP